MLLDKLCIVANSPGFTRRLLGFGLFSQIPHGFGIVTQKTQISPGLLKDKPENNFM